MWKYICRDDSPYIKHYGVKGMQWHKHLKARFEAEVGDYKKALSSEDEKQTYLKSQGMDGKRVMGGKVLTAKEKMRIANARTAEDKQNMQKKTSNDYSYGVSAAEKIRAAKRIRASRNYESAKTVKGKAQDLGQAIAKHHPTIGAAGKQVDKTATEVKDHAKATVKQLQNGIKQYNKIRKYKEQERKKRR